MRRGEKRYRSEAVNERAEREERGERGQKRERREKRAEIIRNIGK